ncbi:3',5'-cyclic adenosine monophosphate phosphodiesterase CpdA [uncultured archaeon]|nr:3',5'-cyclic adenosine monophosphate phosphodiesterase CpdA [uncultured archaeon]
MKKRDKIILGAIVLLLVWIIVWNILPVGTGNWNERQIQQIQSVNSSDHFCFAVLADNKNGFKTFDQIVEDINKRKNFVFAIDVGDLVYDGEKEKYRIFYNEMSEANLPFLVGIGNHDITENGRANYFDIFGNFYYSFSYNNSLFIVLDDANQKDIDSQQMAFLESELKKDFANKFVFLHVPPFDPRGYVFYLGANRTAEHSLSDKENAQKFIDLVSKYNVTTVFTSHIHAYFNETKENVSYIITGGAGGEILPSDPNHYFYHYINFCVNGNNTNYEIIKFPSPKPNSFSRLIHSAWLYSWYYIVVHRYEIAIVILMILLVLDAFYLQIKDFLKMRRKKK